jgi:copper chaperone
MRHDLGLTDVSSTPSAGGGCCGGACASHGEHGSAPAAAAPAGSEQRFGVLGMTCGHCVASVREEVGSVPGVEAVDVRLQVGGTSEVSVRSARPLDRDEVRAAVEEAGYTLTDA